jgi:hypothetical protein
MANIIALTPTGKEQQFKSFWGAISQIRKFSQTPNSPKTDIASFQP